MIHVLINPLSNNKKGIKGKTQLDAYLEGKKFKYYNVTELKHEKEFYEDLPADDEIIIAGGDGTLNHFINDIGDRKLTQKVYMLFCGTGNDFFNDVRDKGVQLPNGLVPMNQYLESLPTVTVNGMTRKFINGIGYGIDGYCCEEGDKIRQTSFKPVDYSKIAIQGLLGGYKPRNAKITVDGVTKEYKRVWLAPTMIGRYYGGNIKVAPSQDRLNPEHTVSSVVMYRIPNLIALINFPKVIAGKHEKCKSFFDGRTGHEVTVEFDVPCALQIDGETVLNVKSYSVSYH